MPHFTFSITDYIFDIQLSYQFFVDLLAMEMMYMYNAVVIV